MQEDQNRFDQLLREAVQRGASDIHLAPGLPPRARIHGELLMLDAEPLPVETQRAWTGALLSPAQRQVLEREGNVDLGYGNRHGQRFRINLFRSLGHIRLVARHLPERFASLEELGMPPTLRDLAFLPSGLVLVTGATGSGKSTTLATLINEINANSARHIVTIEDPVEFVHTPQRSIISHRELHTDVIDFAGAVRAALREDPDVIMVGEMRDTETMRAALTAAETGHLVFSTLHTADTVGAIERFIGGGFAADEQELVRYRLSLVLRSVIAQQLLPGSEEGRVAAVEVLHITAAVANLIASGRTHQIYSAIEAGHEIGMQTFDRSLAELARARRIDGEQAALLARDKTSFSYLMQHGGSPSATSASTSASTSAFSTAFSTTPNGTRR